MRCLHTLFALLLLAGTAAADAAVLGKTTTGTPELQSIEVIRFAPGGVLLLGDGRGAQVIAIETSGAAAKGAFKESITGIDGKLAAKIGATAKGIEIVDLAVHPTTQTAFIAIRQQANRRSIILTVDGEGKIDEFPLEKVKYAKVALPAGEKAPVSRVTDMVWIGERLLVAGVATEEFASKLFSAPGPLNHDAKAAVHATETYHVQHGKWETRAPMTSLMALVEENKAYVAGAFACTPVVKYPVDELKPGEKVKGRSMIELGSGNRPLNMFTYEKDGKSYVLMNTVRLFPGKKPIGPSKYWTARFERDLLFGDKTVNEKAVRRVDGQLEPLTDRIKVAEDFHGVMHMDKLGEDRALTIKEDKDGPTLVAIKLP